MGFPCMASAQATGRTKIGDCMIVHAVRRGKTTKADQGLKERFYCGRFGQSACLKQRAVKAEASSVKATGKEAPQVRTYMPDSSTGCTTQHFHEAQACLR